MKGVKCKLCSRLVDTSFNLSFVAVCLFVCYALDVIFYEYELTSGCACHVPLFLAHTHTHFASSCNSYCLSISEGMQYMRQRQDMTRVVIWCTRSTSPYNWNYTRKECLVIRWEHTQDHSGVHQPCCLQNSSVSAVPYFLRLPHLFPSGISQFTAHSVEVLFPGHRRQEHGVFLHRELRIRLAQRVLELESLPSPC